MVEGRKKVTGGGQRAQSNEPKAEKVKTHSVAVIGQDEPFNLSKCVNSVNFINSYVTSLLFNRHTFDPNLINVL